ncbi:MAG: GNAT family N-acetyltransferase [Chloroflexi bacterium]|nr:GNAT family N-acetyltransferase [Chloroflexota bacterium]
MIITTPRLVVRTMQREDLDTMVAWPPYPDPLDAIFNWPHMLRENGTTDIFFLTRSSDARRREWTILTNSGTVIGHVGIRDIQPRPHSSRLGIGLGLPYTGQGYGEEVLRGFLDAYFGPLRFSRLYLDVSLHNTRALRLYQRLGFRELSTFWNELGPAGEHAYLDDPRYDPIREHIRWSAATVYMRYAAMVLQAEEWLPPQS